MVTVKDLIDYLTFHKPDLPIYWGVDEQPCWVAKRNAELRDFPMAVQSKSPLGNPLNPKDWYLYFGDYRDTERYQKELIRACSLPFMGRLRYLFTGTIRNHAGYSSSGSSIPLVGRLFSDPDVTKEE